MARSLEMPSMPIVSLDHVQVAIPVVGENRAREFTAAFSASRK
jgi:hypothetical protein